MQEFGRISWQSVVGLSKVFSPNGVRSYIDDLTNKPAASDGRRHQQRRHRLVTRHRCGPSCTPNGVADFLLLLAVINISLGLFNLFPLLPFDGGHVVIATYEAIRSRKGRRYHADVTQDAAGQLRHHGACSCSSSSAASSSTSSAPWAADRDGVERRATRQIYVGRGCRRRRRADHACSR